MRRTPFLAFSLLAFGVSADGRLLIADGRLLYYQLPIPFYYLTRVYDQFPIVGKIRMEVIEGPWGGASKVNAVLVVLAPMTGTLKDALFFGPMHGASQVLA